MKYVNLGDTGLKVSELCLGTMTFGHDFFHIAEQEQGTATDFVETALDAGVNFFDTADVYSKGESEEMLGEALDDAGVDRHEVVIATKVRGAMSEQAKEGTWDVNNVGLSRKHIIEGCNASLDRLDTDYIDLYQVHSWDFDAPLEETLAALNQLVEEGKVLYLGVSNWPAYKIAKALEIQRKNNWAEFVSLQAYYSLAGRELEHELLKLADEEGLGVLPWSPLAGGFLTGKYTKDGDAPEGARRAEPDFDFPPVDKENGFRAIDRLEKLAETKGASIPQLALRWLLEQQAVSSVILGASKLPQLKENLGTQDVDLTESETAELNEITDPGKQYPYWMIDRHKEMAGEDEEEREEKTASS